MGGTTGVDGVCRKYIIRDIKPQGWVAAHNSKMDEERLIYLVPLHGPGYNIYNHAVWHELQNCCIGDIAYDWIR